MTRIILASQSPRRKKLLEQLGLGFEIFPSSVPEHFEDESPVKTVEELALRKARDVAPSCPGSLIIGADTIVVHKGEILGKPENEEHAFELLSRLNGTWHEVYTGVALVKSDKNGGIEAEKSFHQQTKVQFSTLLEEEIQSYIKSGSPMDKAGAYGIQDDWGALFVERIEGDFYNVVGFPLNKFYRELKYFQPEVLLSN